jgi:uncharacterized protein (DUF433 family)/DNA-binding transcriptional MerR regulator
MLDKRQQTSMVGKGLYSLTEAAQLLGVSNAKARRWADPQAGLVRRILDPAEQVLTFVELMELHFIRLFREEGVSLPAIRKAAQAASKKFRTSHPFAVKRFDTDGRSIFATLVDEDRDAVLVEDLRSGQYVFESVIRPFFRKLDYRGAQEVCRYWPMDKQHRVVLDPERQFGAPIDAPSGVPTRSLYDAVSAGRGQSKALVADWFNVPVEAVEAAMDFEESLKRRALLLR